MGDDDKELQEKLESVLRLARTPAAARNAVAMLFPKVERVLQTYIPSGPTDFRDRNRQRRISQRDFAPTYFRLDPEPASWGRAELEAIFGAKDPQHALSEAKARIELVSGRERPRLRRLLLDAFNGAFNAARPISVEWLRALIDISPYFLKEKDETTGGLFSVDNLQRLSWALVSALEDKTPDERFELFSGVIPEASDFTVFCDFVRSRLGDKNPKGARRNDDELYFGKRSDELREMLVNSLRELARSNKIWSQAKPEKILWFWWGCDFEAEVHSVTSAALSTDDGLRSLLEVCIGLVRSSSGNYEHVNRRSWSAIVDIEGLERRARELVESATEESDRVRGRRFLDALAKGDEGGFQ